MKFLKYLTSYLQIEIVLVLALFIFCPFGTRSMVHAFSKTLLRRVEEKLSIKFTSLYAKMGKSLSLKIQSKLPRWIFEHISRKKIMEQSLLKTLRT